MASPMRSPHGYISSPTSTGGAFVVPRPAGRDQRRPPAKLLSKSLVLRDIYGVANDSFQHPVFYNRGTDAANMSDFAVRSRNAFGDITS